MRDFEEANLNTNSAHGDVHTWVSKGAMYMHLRLEIVFSFPFDGCMYPLLGKGVHSCVWKGIYTQNNNAV